MQPITETVLKDINLSLVGNALTFERSEKSQVTLGLSDAQATQVRGALRFLAPPGTPAADEMTAHSAKVRIQGSLVEISKLDVKIVLNFLGAGTDTGNGIKDLATFSPNPEPKHNDRFAEYCFHRSDGATAIGFSDHLAARKKYSGLLETGIQGLGLTHEEATRLRGSITYAHVETALQSFVTMYNRWAQCELNEYAPKGGRLSWQEVTLDSGRDGEGAARSKDARLNPATIDDSRTDDRRSERVMLASELIVDAYLRAFQSAQADNFRGDPSEVLQRRALSSLLLGDLPGGGDLADWKILKFPDSVELSSFTDSLETELDRKLEGSMLIFEQTPSVLLLCAEERWKRDHRKGGEPQPRPHDLREWYTQTLKETDGVRLTDSQWISPQSMKETVSGAVNLEDYFALYRRAREELTTGLEVKQLEILAAMKRAMSEFTHNEIIQIFEDKLHGIHDTLDRGKNGGLPSSLLIKEEERRTQTEYFLHILRKFA